MSGRRSHQVRLLRHPPVYARADALRAPLDCHVSPADVASLREAARAAGLRALRHALGGGRDKTAKTLMLMAGHAADAALSRFYADPDDAPDIVRQALIVAFTAAAQAH